VTGSEAYFCLMDRLLFSGIFQSHEVVEHICVSFSRTHAVHSNSFLAEGFLVEERLRTMNFYQK